MQCDISRVAILLSILDAHEGSARLISMRPDAARKDSTAKGLVEMSLHWPPVVNISPLVVRAAMRVRKSILVLSTPRALSFDTAYILAESLTTAWKCRQSGLKPQ